MSHYDCDNCGYSFGLFYGTCENCTPHVYLNYINKRNNNLDKTISTDIAYILYDYDHYEEYVKAYTEYNIHIPSCKDKLPIYTKEELIKFKNRLIAEHIEKDLQAIKDKYSKYL